MNLCGSKHETGLKSIFFIIMYVHTYILTFWLNNFSKISNLFLVLRRHLKRRQNSPKNQNSKLWYVYKRTVCVRPLIIKILYLGNVFSLSVCHIKYGYRLCRYFGRDLNMRRNINWKIYKRKYEVWNYNLNLSE